MQELKYSDFKNLPEFARRNALAVMPLGIIENEQHRELLIELAANEPAEDIRQRAIELLEGSKKLAEDPNLNWGDGREKSKEQVLSLLTLDQLHLFREDSSKKYLEGKTPAPVPSNVVRIFAIPFIIFVIGVVVIVLGITNPSNVSGNLAIGGLFWLFFVLVFTYVSYTQYKDSRAYAKDGKLYLGQIAGTQVITRTKRVGSGNNRRSVTVNVLQVSYRFKIADNVQTGNAEREIGRARMNFGTSLDTLSKEHAIPTGTQIAVAYINENKSMML